MASEKAPGRAVDPARVEELMEREQRRFAEGHERSRELHERAKGSLLSGVPMNWMTRWPGQFPIFVAEAHGASVTDVDGNTYVDLCLGDTGAMPACSSSRPSPTSGWCWRARLSR